MFKILNNPGYYLNRLYYLLLLTILIPWLFINTAYVPNVSYAPPGDNGRETAITYNILEGNITGDQSYLGETAFYPYLMHLIFAGFHLITRIPVQSLYANYSIIISLPTVLIFIYILNKISKSLLFTSLGLIIFLYVMPWTMTLMTLVAHSTILAFGIIMLLFYLISLAYKTNRIMLFVFSGLSLSLTVYNHPLAFYTVLISLFLFQFIIRKYWLGFFFMLVVSAIGSIAYLMPIVVKYHMIIKNQYPLWFMGVFQNPSLLYDYLFFGFGPAKWINTFFIIIGLFVSFKEKKIFPRLISLAFLVTLFFMLIGWIEDMNIIPKIIPIYMPQGFQQYNHLYAVFLLCIGLFFILEMIARKLPGYHTAIITSTIFMVIFYSSVSYKQFLKVSNNMKKQIMDNNYRSFEWQGLVNWIWQNTSIYDVFLASDYRSYHTISALTGRKLVANASSHSNPYVDQMERYNDAALLYSTDDMKIFKTLADKYRLKYILVTPEEYWRGPGITKFSDTDNFIPVYSQNQITLFKYLE